MKSSPAEHVAFAAITDPRDPLHDLRVRVDFHPTLKWNTQWEITILGVFRLDDGGEVDHTALPLLEREELFEACEQVMKTKQ